MKLRNLFLSLTLIGWTGIASADLEPWKDYELSDWVSNITMVKVDANMIDKYLEGLSKTWAPANEVAKELGHIQDYWISVSQLPNSGEFNVVLGIVFENSAAMQPSQAKYEAFMAKWGEENQKQSDEIVMTYPDIREIVGQYHMREVKLK